MRPPNYNFPKIRFCRRGHAVVGDNILIEHRSVTCRKCDNLSHKKARKSGNVGEVIVRRVLEALREGKTMAEISGRRGGRYIGSKIILNTRLDAFCSQHPKIGERIRALSTKNAITQRLAKIETRRARPLITSPAIHTSNDIKEVIQAAVPRGLPADHRDDAIQNIWMAVLEGRLTCSEIAARAREFIRAEYKSNHNAWGPRSLDARLFDDGNATLLNRLSTEAGTGYWDINMMASTGRRK